MDDHIQEIFNSTPFNRYMNYRLVKRDGQHAIVTMPVRNEYIQESGAVQGGVISSLADTAAAYVLLPEALDGTNRGVGLEFKMNFLYPAFAGKGDLEARSSLVKRGKRVAICDVDVFQGDSYVAKGTFTYLVF